jgi:hypothetical protein
VCGPCGTVVRVWPDFVAHIWDATHIVSQIRGDFSERMDNGRVPDVATIMIQYGYDDGLSLNLGFGGSLVRELADGYTLLAGSANPALADAVAAQLGTRLGACEVDRFPDGEL